MAKTFFLKKGKVGKIFFLQNFLSKINHFDAKINIIDLYFPFTDITIFS